MATNKTPARLTKTPNADDIINWTRSLVGQLARQKQVAEEAKRAQANPNYRSSLKMSPRYQEFFEQELKTTKNYNKAKNRNNNGGNKNS